MIDAIFAQNMPVLWLKKVSRHMKTCVNKNAGTDITKQTKAKSLIIRRSF
jgi:hypothetical protein